MHRYELRQGDQVRRIERLIDEIDRAFAARDFDRLTQLGNRLATDSVIAKALDDAEDEQAPTGPARAA